MRKSLWFLNHYAITPDMPGGTRHFDLARELTDLGYEVTIVASAFNHSLRRNVRLLDGEPWAVEEVDGVRFVWLPTITYQHNDWRRMANMLDYTWRAYWLGRRLPRKAPDLAPPDVVVGCAVHLFAVLAGYYLSRHFGAHFVMEVRDLWPQTFLDMGLWREDQPQVRFFRWLEKFLYARAERIVTLSPLTRGYLADYSSEWAAKVVLVPNGTQVARFEQAETAPRSQPQPLRVMFLGSMGVTNGVDLIIEAMDIAEQTNPGLLVASLVGGGPEKPHLQQMVQDRGLKNVEFHDPVPRAKVPELATRADMLVLVQREVLYGSSNKLFDYMAAGRPIVFSVFAEHNNLVEEARCGLSASPESAADLADKLIAVARMPAEERRAMGQRGRDYVREHHDYGVLARRVAEMVEELDGSGPQ